MLKLFDELCDEFGIALILVSHDLRVVGSHTDQVAVMYAGRMVEIGSAAAVFERPMMRYSRALMDALPKRDPAGHELPKPIPGHAAEPAVAAARLPVLAPLRLRRGRLP